MASGLSISAIALKEVFELADRVTVLRETAGTLGRVQVADIGKDDLISMMVGRTIETLFPKVDCGAR